MLRFSIHKLMRVIALFAVVLGIYVFLVRQAEDIHDNSLRSACAQNVKNILLGLLGYENSMHTFPPGTWPNPNLALNDRLSWYTEMSGYIELQNLHEILSRAQPWNVGANHRLACTLFGVIRCPDRTVTPPGPVPTTYIGIAGLGKDAPLLPKGDRRAGVFGYDRQTTIADITDGLGTTMMIAETGRASGSWLAGGPATVRGLNPDEQPYIGSGRQFGGRHHGGAMIGMADGSVRCLRDAIDPKVFEAQSTIAEGEKIPDWASE